MKHKLFTKLRFAILTLLSFLLAMPSYSQVVVQMQKEKGGTYIIAGKVNGLDLNFIFDTGASDVCISSAEAIYMLKNGYLKESDITGSSYTQIANGDIIENTRIILREIEVGGVVIHNVSASVVHNLNAPLLFGQSAIQKLGPIQLDDNLLIIKNGISGAKGLNLDIFEQLYFLLENEKFTEALSLAKKTLIHSKSQGERYVLYSAIIDCYEGLNQKEKVLETCREALKENYYYPNPRFQLGILYCQQNKFHLAIEELERFVSLIPTYQKAAVPALKVTPVYCKEGYYYLGHVQLETGDLENAEKNLLMSFQYEKEAVPYSRLTTEIYNRNCIQARLDLGNIYRMQGKTALAIEYYEKAISIEPNSYHNIDSYYYLGFCYMANRDFEKAISSFQECKRLTSISNDKDIAYYIPLSCLNLGRTYLFLKKYRESLREYEAALYAQEIAPGLFDERDFYSMANIYTRFDKIEQAKEILNKGLLVFKDNPDLLFFKSRIDETNQIEILETILKKEITYEPIFFDYATVYNNLAWAYCQQGEYEKGLPLAHKSVKMNATYAYSWDTLGDICYNLGMYQECIDAMTKCIELEPNSKRAYEFRGNAKIQIGKTKDGEKDLKMAKSLSGN